MANGGRVRHHLANNLANRRNHVVFVGYQAQGTLGRLLVNRVPRVRLFGHEVEVRARIHTVGGLSAHADQQGLLAWYGAGPARPPVVLVHGEDPARDTLADELRRRYGCEVALSQPGMQREV
jgi:metallo-beta-lactamase family protein